MLNILKLSLLCALVPATVLAHHGFGGRYDRNNPVYLEGLVVSAFFGQPHPELVVMVDAAAPVPPDLAGRFPGLVAWPGPEATVEFPPVRAFFALDGAVIEGDRIALVALRNCEPPNQLRGQWLKTTDGNVVEASGRLQTEVEGC